MTAADKAAPPDKGAAARSEAKGEPKTVAFRDLTLELPAELPNTLLFDVTEVAESDGNPLPLFRVLRSLLGQEHFTAVRDALKAEDESLVIVDDLLVEIFAAYGLTLGE